MVGKKLVQARVAPFTEKRPAGSAEVAADCCLSYYIYYTLSGTAASLPGGLPCDLWLFVSMCPVVHLLRPQLSRYFDFLFQDPKPLVTAASAPSTGVSAWQRRRLFYCCALTKTSIVYASVFPEHVGANHRLQSSAEFSLFFSSYFRVPVSPDVESSPKCRVRVTSSMVNFFVSREAGSRGPRLPYLL